MNNPLSTIMNETFTVPSDPALAEGFLNNLRQKAISNTLTSDELKQALVILRESRVASAQTSSRARKVTSKTQTASSDDMLAELDGL